MTKALKRWALFTVIYCGGILALSGQWTSPLIWTFAICMSALVLYALSTIEPDLANERFHPPTPGLDDRGERGDPNPSQRSPRSSSRRSTADGFTGRRRFRTPYASPPWSERSLHSCSASAP